MPFSNGEITFFRPKKSQRKSWASADLHYKKDQRNPCIRQECGFVQGNEGCREPSCPEHKRQLLGPLILLRGVGFTKNKLAFLIVEKMMAFLLSPLHSQFNHSRPPVSFLSSLLRLPFCSLVAHLLGIQIASKYFKKHSISLVTFSFLFKITFKFTLKFLYKYIIYFDLIQPLPTFARIHQTVSLPTSCLLKNILLL